jgi:hypothetical protein
LGRYHIEALGQHGGHDLEVVYTGLERESLEIVEDPLAGVCPLLAALVYRYMFALLAVVVVLIVAGCLATENRHFLPSLADVIGGP